MGKLTAAAENKMKSERGITISSTCIDLRCFCIVIQNQYLSMLVSYDPIQSQPVALLLFLTDDK